jgi:ABC-2 type transport system permease protein
MNWNAITAISARDLTLLRRNTGVLVPMIVVPIVLLVILIGATLFAARSGDLDLAVVQDLLVLLAGEQGSFAGADRGAQLAILLATYGAPPLLVIVPLVTSSVTATDSIAGERERGTIEGLLLAPISDRDLFVGKLIGALVPALLIGIVAQVCYLLAAGLILLPETGQMLAPTAPWLSIVLWFAPAFTTAALGLTVLVSARAKTVQSAFQISGIAVLPIVVLTVSQGTGLFVLRWWIALLVGAVMWAVAFVLIRTGARALSRERQIATLA